MKKYKLSEITKRFAGVTLHRIEALMDFAGVNKGDIGGWVQHEENLSHFGDCWIYDEALVGGRATVGGSAIVMGNATVWGHAVVKDYTVVQDYAKVWGDAAVGGYAIVWGDAAVGGGTVLKGDDVLGYKSR